MSTWQLYLFGTPRLLHNGAVVEVGLRKAVALLIYVAVTKQPHSRDALATLFWPEQGQREARTALRRTLYRLQEDLRTELLTIDSDRIALAPAAPLWVDLDAFQQAAAQALANDADATSPASLAALTKAADLYVADFLAGFTLPDSPAFDEWQFFECETARQQFAAVLERLLLRYKECQAWDEAIGHARRWLALDALTEPVHRQLMVLYALAGQQSAALRQYQECVRLLDEELGVEPEAETTALFEAIRARRFPTVEPLRPATVTHDAATADRPTSSPPLSGSSSRLATPPLSHNLPPQPTAFVGRVQDVAAISDRLQEPTCRLLTLVGPGGVGKTRLALHVAQVLVDQQPPVADFAHGVFFVALATVSDASGVLAALAEAVGLQFSDAQSPQQQLLDHLADKALLLVLDNFEQLLTASPTGAPQSEALAVIATLLAQAPAIKLLVTSREALTLREEWFHPISGLSLPPANAIQTLSANQYDAVRLFDQCARRASTTFSLAAEAQTVVQICRLVEGMPLAIELAAAWLKVLTVEDVAKEIEHDLDILATQYRNVPERHRSLRIVFEQTWQRLSVAEQTLLGNLAVFEGGFSYDAAVQVAAGTIATIMELIDKALLRREEQTLTPSPVTSPVASRFHFHQLLQQYAREKVAAAPASWAQIKTAHANYYLALLERSSQTLNSAERKQALAVLEVEFANIRAAWRWAIERNDLDALRRYAMPLATIFVNRPQEGASLFAQAAAALDATDPAHHAALSVVLIGQAEQLLRLGLDPEQSIALAEQALALLKPASAPAARLKALNLIGNGVWLQGDHHKARTILAEGLTVARTHGAPAEVGELLIRLGLVEREISDRAAVMAFYQYALAELRVLDVPVHLAHQLLIYGEYLVNHEQIQAGQQFLSESLALAQASGSTDFYPFILLHLAVAFYKLGDYAQAETHLQEIITISQAEGRVHPESLAQLYFGRVKLAQNALPAAEDHLRAGLRLGWTHKLTLVMTLALVCFAEFYDAQGDPARAACLLAVALDHPAIEARDRAAAACHLQTLQAKLSAAELEQALAHANAATLEEIVTQALNRQRQSSRRVSGSVLHITAAN